jgi:hypothetical protein
LTLYRKKPVVIEAIQLDPCGAHRHALPEGVYGVPSPGADNWAYEGCRFFIDTLEGKMEALPGDFIITGVQGEKYPCKPSIFWATYERAPGTGG